MTGAAGTCVNERGAGTYWGFCPATECEIEVRLLLTVFLVAVSPVAAAPIDGWAEESRRGAEDVNVEDCRDA